jgi:hypothetical protein
MSRTSPSRKRRQLAGSSPAGGRLADPTRRLLLAEIAQHPALTATQLAIDLPDLAPGGAG